MARKNKLESDYIFGMFGSTIILVSMVGFLYFRDDTLIYISALLSICVAYIINTLYGEVKKWRKKATKKR